MRLRLSFPEAELLLGVARAIPNTSPEMARALSICYADLAPFKPLGVVTKGEKKLKMSARSRVECESGFGVLSIGTTDSIALITALRSHLGAKLLSDMEAALLERLERFLVVMVTEQKEGRDRPRSNPKESAVPKAPAPLPVWSSLLPPELEGWLISESELQEAYQTLRGVGLQ